MSIGLDIGSKTVKVVELDKSGDRYVLRSAGATAISGAEIDKMTDEREFAAIATSIKKLFKDAKISGREVNIALPETQVFTRVVKLPLLTNEEIASSVKWEAEEYIPIPLKDAILQYQILERREVGNPPQVLVLLIAAVRAAVEKYVHILSLADIKVVGVETELLSLARVSTQYGKALVVVDFGAKSTDIAIVKEGQLFFSRSIPTAGDAFSRAVAQALGIAPQQAEEYKRTYGFAAGQLEDKVASALIPLLKVIVEEIKKSIHFYQMDMHGETPTAIVLAGGSAGIPGLSAELAKLTGIEVAVSNPFANITVDPSAAQSLSNYAPLYSVAVGLAQR